MSKKLDEKRKKIQKEPREVERLSCFNGNAGEPHGVNATSVARGGEKEERSHAKAPKGAKDGTKDTKHLRQEKIYTETKLGGKRRNAENQRKIE